MDLSDTIIPKSDQLNAEDLLTGPATVTITDVRSRGTVDQPVDVHLAEYPGRPFRPSKTVRRILVAAWGRDGSVYVGRRMTLYRDPKVKWAGQEVGGIRVSHLSHIEQPLVLALTVAKGRRDSHVVRPLTEDAPAPAAPAPMPAAAQELHALNAGLTALGYADKPAIYAVLSRELGRPIASGADLTPGEVVRLIGRIKRQEVAPAAAAAVEPASDSVEPASDTFVEEPPAGWQPEGDDAQSGGAR